MAYCNRFAIDLDFRGANTCLIYYYLAKAHKKSYDSMIKASPNKSSSKPNAERNRSSSRQKDMRDYLHKGSMTPSSGQSRPFDKISDGKLRK